MRSPGRPIADPASPAAIAIAPDGTTAYVTNFSGGSEDEDGSITPINLATGRPDKPIGVGGAPEAIAITPKGTDAYVVNFNDDSVTVVRLKH